MATTADTLTPEMIHEFNDLLSTTTPYLYEAQRLFTEVETSTVAFYEQVLQKCREQVPYAGEAVVEFSIGAVAAEQSSIQVTVELFFPELTDNDLSQYPDAFALSILFNDTVDALLDQQQEDA